MARVVEVARKEPMPDLSDLLAQLYAQRGMETMAASDEQTGGILAQLQAQRVNQYRHKNFGTKELPAMVPPAMADDDLNRRARASAHDIVQTGEGQADMSGLTHVEASEVTARQLKQQQMITDGQKYGITVKPQPPTIYGAQRNYENNYGKRTQVGGIDEEMLSMKGRQPEVPYLEGEADKETRAQAEAVVRMKQASVLQQALARMTSLGPVIPFDDDAELARQIVPNI